MARGRIISRSLSTSQKRAALHHVAGRFAEFAQGLYPLLVVHADDFGRLQGDLFTVKHVIDPSSPRKLSDFKAALTALHAVGLIEWYEVDDRKYIQIQNFEAHQLGLHKRTRSELPESSGKFPEFPSEEKRREGKGTEGKRTEQKKETAAAPLAAPVENHVLDSPVFDRRAIRQQLAKQSNGNNYKVLAKIARDAITDGTTYGELPREVEDRALEHRITFTHETVVAACESEWFKHEHPDLVKS